MSVKIWTHSFKSLLATDLKSFKMEFLIAVLAVLTALSPLIAKHVKYQETVSDEMVEDTAIVLRDRLDRCSNQSKNLIVLIKSARHKFKLRDDQRKTFLSEAEVRFEYAFVLGLESNQENEVFNDKLIREEDAIHNDLQIGNFVDS